MGIDREMQVKAYRDRALYLWELFSSLKTEAAISPFLTEIKQQFNLDLKIMDQILKSYVTKFVDDIGRQNFDGTDQANIFEHFVNYTILSRIHPEPFDINIVKVGGDDDGGIDGLAILVNDHIISSKEEIDYFRKELRRFDIKFVFIQSKTSPKFDSGDLGKFLFGVSSFFKEEPPTPINPTLENLRSLKNYIYEHSLDMTQLPACEMFYVTTGTWTGEPKLEGRVQAEKTALEATKLVKFASFIPVDNEHLRRLYSELRRKVNKEINFEKHTAMPSIGEVHQAYIGILPALEYLKLITDSDDNLARSLFYDNVRDFQGLNPVNQEIEATIKDKDQSDRFALLNNGITVVAKDVQQVGSRFTIRDYQIVNGCQTSHVIFMNKNALTDKMFVPLKLIVTSNIEVTNQIILATNRQTQIHVEAFESTKPFHKELEEFYNTFKEGRKVYYERRSKQYDESSIEPNHIISLATQVKCFLGMFQNEPQSTHRYYGELLKSYKDKIFQEEHSLYPYYCSGYAYSLLESFFVQNKLDAKKYRQFRFHLLMLFRMLVETSQPPHLNHKKKIETYCKSLHEAILNEEKALKTFNEASVLIDKALTKVSYNQFDATRRKAFTTEIINLLDSELPKKKEFQGLDSSRFRPAEVEREEGQVIWFSSIKGYGFIQGNHPKEIFVHINDIRDGEQILNPKDVVEFVLVENQKGLNAKAVNIVKRAAS